MLRSPGASIYTFVLVNQVKLSTAYSVIPEGGNRTRDIVAFLESAKLPLLLVLFDGIERLL